MTTHRDFNSGASPFHFLTSIGLRRGMVFGSIIVTALLAFEIFNYSTTQYALADLLGNLRFAGVPWSTILAIAFCGIDFAGIARLFTPELGGREQNEAWYLFGAWMLAATMNAILTWWGVSIALVNHQTQSSAVMSPTLLLKVVPVFVALMVWLIRILIIGTFSLSGERLFTQGDQPHTQQGVQAERRLSNRPLSGQSAAPFDPASRMPSRTSSYPAPSFSAPKPEPTYSRPEPTYQSLGVSARPANPSAGKREL